MEDETEVDNQLDDCPVAGHSLHRMVLPFIVFAQGHGWGSGCQAREVVWL